ncbi:MAG: hypothetical protein V8S26_11405 [Lachnospiraceae bacterium]
MTEKGGDRVLSYILCKTKTAKKPFFIENISTNIYSMEELCYYLYNNLYLIDDTLLNEKLCVWLKDELETAGAFQKTDSPYRTECFCRRDDLAGV